MSNAPINFENVDALRKRMLLTTTQIAMLFGVSRVTYYNWLKGRKPRDLHARNVRDVLRKLFACIDVYNWPMQEVLVASQKDRIVLLLDTFKSLDKREANTVG